MLNQYQERTYREKTKGHELIEHTLIQSESDLQLYSNVDVTEPADLALTEIRRKLKSYIAKRPSFETSLEPISQDESAPQIIQKMIEASRQAGVGPMAAVAGAVSEYVGSALLSSHAELTDIFIENGGDIFIKTTSERRILIHAGASVLSEKLAIRVQPEMTPCGICTSSGTVGHSLSFGKGDAVVIISKDTCTADAAATSVCNTIKGEDDISSGLAFAQSIEGVEGALIIVNDKLGAWGNIEIC